VTAPAFATPTPWRRIWTRPRATLRSLVDAGPNHSALIISAGWGVVQSLLQGAQNNVGARAPVFAILLMAIPIGALWGLLQLYLLTGLFYLVGRWTGARVPFNHVRSVVAWASLPLAATLGLWLVGTLVFGRSFFLDVDVVAATEQPGLLLSLGILYLATLGLWVWSLVILIQGLAEVQRVSAAKAIGTVVAGLLMFGAAILMVVAFLALVLWK